MLYYSKHSRIFAGNGLVQEKVLLLKFFNNYSIMYFFKLIKIIEKGLKLSRRLSFISYFAQKVDLTTFNFLENEKLKTFLLKRFIVMHFLFFLESLRKQKYSLYDVELERNYLFNFKHSIKFLKKDFKKINKYKLWFESKYISSKLSLEKSKYLYKKNFKFLYTLPRMNFFKFINSELNYNLYIIGESCDYFKGRVVPFYRSEYSWLVSTGLKGDIECHDMDIPSLKVNWKNYCRDVSKEKFDLDFYKYPLKSVIFQLSNFSKVLKRGSEYKKQVRHLYVYSFVNYFGKQKFISEKLFSFNYKQKIFFINSIYNVKYFSNIPKILKISKLKFFRGIRSIKVLYKLQRNRFIFILLKSLKYNFDYKDTLVKNFFRILGEFSDISYKNFIYILKIQRILGNKLLNLFKIFIRNFFLNYLVVESVKIQNYEQKFFLIYYSYQVCLIYFRIFEYIKLFVANPFYSKYFLEKMIIHRMKLYFKTLAIEADNNKKPIKMLAFLEEITNIGGEEISYDHIRIYISFTFDLLVWKINLRKKFLHYQGLFRIYGFFLQINFQTQYVKKLKQIWLVEKNLNYKVFYNLFRSFMLDFIQYYKKFFYLFVSLKENKPTLDNFFEYYTLLSFLHKLKVFYKLKVNLFKINKVYNLLYFSEFFLGKWFYYRYLNKAVDNSFDINNNLHFLFKFNYSDYNDSVFSKLNLLLTNKKIINTKLYDYFVHNLGKNLIKSYDKISSNDRFKNFLKFFNLSLFFIKKKYRIEKNLGNIILTRNIKSFFKRIFLFRKKYAPRLGAPKKRKFFLKLFKRFYIYKTFTLSRVGRKAFQHVRNMSFTTNNVLRNNYSIKGYTKFMNYRRFRKRYKFFMRNLDHSFPIKSSKTRKNKKFVRFLKRKIMRKQRTSIFTSFENKVFTNTFMIIYKKPDTKKKNPHYYYWWFFKN